MVQCTALLEVSWIDVLTMVLWNHWNLGLEVDIFDHGDMLEFQWDVGLKLYNNDS